MNADVTVDQMNLDDLIPSKTNPRKNISAAYLDELAASIRTRGVLQPITIRAAKAGKDGGKYEIVLGECRFRASKIAGNATVPALVRTLTDEEVIDMQLIENIQRKDLSPLEVARGYRALIDSNPTKHSAESIATRVGMSVGWVWDRLKLNDLIPEAKVVLDAEHIDIRHAILISRQTPANQKRILAVDRDQPGGRAGGLWEVDGGFNFDDRQDKGKDPYHGLKPVSVRELEKWIDDHVRFDVKHAATAAPLEFEPVAAAVDAALAKPGRGKKVIAITFDHFTRPEARDENERTYGPKSWKYADGQSHRDPYTGRTAKASTCDLSVLGVVAAGDDRGKAFDVCISRDKCETHWKKEIAAKTKTQKLRSAGKTRSADKREAAEAARERREDEKREAAEARWKAFYPALKKAVTEAAGKLPAKLPAAVYRALLNDCRLPATTKPERFAVELLLRGLRDRFSTHAYQGNEGLYVHWAKALGVDVKACEPKAAVAASAKAKGKGKKAGTAAA